MSTTGQLTIEGCGELPEKQPGRRYCGCECGEPIDHLSERAKYLDNRHAMRAYRKRVKREMERAGLPASPSLRAARVSRPTREHNGDAQTAAQGAQTCSRSGAQVSFYRAINTLHAELGLDRSEVEAVLIQALPARQRERIQRLRGNAA